MSYLLVVLRSTYSAFIASFIAWQYFPNRAALGAAAVVAISLRITLESLLNQNRQAIWEERINPWRATFTLAMQIVIIFFTVFLIFGAMELFVIGDFSSEKSTRFGFGFQELFLHNLSVLTSGFVLCLLLSSGGLLLILAWNACHWSTSFIHFFWSSEVKSENFIQTAFSYMPHLFLEVVSYILAGLAGVFLSKAILKYPILSEEFRRVSMACIVIGAVSVGLLLMATSAEIYIAIRNP